RADDLPERHRVALDQRHRPPRPDSPRTTAFERAEQLDDVAEARLALGLEGGEDRRVEPARAFGTVARGRHQLAEPRPLECLGLAERRLAGEPAVERDAERELIG